jgi:hypothetical protein
MTSISQEIIRDFSNVVLPTLPEVPGMIKKEEGQYLYWLTSEYYDGSASVVEIGTWLGKSTMHLAAGLQSKNATRKLICYDHFEWAGGANWLAKSKTSHTAGSDFMDDFLDNVSDYSHLIDARKSKIKDIEFDPQKISILVLDAPKRVADISKIYRCLSKKVELGTTILAWQDFLHPASFEIPACLYAMAKYQEPAHVVSDGTLVGFRAIANWDVKDVTPEILSFNDWSLSECFEAWEYWDIVVPDYQKPSFQSGLAMLLHDLGYYDEALNLLSSVIDDKLCRLRWNKWKATSLSKRYAKLFETVT